MYCGSIKTTTANILFQTLAVVLKWWRRHYFFIVPKIKNIAFPMVFCVFIVAKISQTNYKCTTVCTEGSHGIIIQKTGLQKWQSLEVLVRDMEKW